MANPPFTPPQLGKLARALEGPVYVAVGLGVLGFQRAQVYRRSLERAVERQAGPVRQAVTDLTGEATQHLPEPARDLLDAVSNLVNELPSEARALVNEAVALGRFVVQAAGAPASRYASRQQL